MSSESLSVNYEMATVLFIDIVGYSMQPIDRQMGILSTLQTVVKESVSYQRAQADKELIAIPSGDGMALVFLRSPVMPVRCALEIAGALRAHPEVDLRMGIHTGPVCRHEDIKESINIVGGGINTAQRVMNSGDAGHILLSHHRAGVLHRPGPGDSVGDQRRPRFAHRTLLFQGASDRNYRIGIGRCGLRRPRARIHWTRPSQRQGAGPAGQRLFTGVDHQWNTVEPGEHRSAVTSHRPGASQRRRNGN
jgi:adenylate/guanylate cyclase family protein